MPSNAEQIRAARAQKLAENQAHRAAKRKQAKAVVVTVERTLTHDERAVSDAIKALLDHSLATKGDAQADTLARDTRFWVGFMKDKFPKLTLQAFAAAEASRWYEARHPRPARPAGRRDDFGGRK